MRISLHDKPRFKTAEPANHLHRHGSKPAVMLSPEQIRRIVAEMIG